MNRRAIDLRHREPRPVEFYTPKFKDELEVANVILARNCLFTIWFIPFLMAPPMPYSLHYITIKIKRNQNC
jgi:hypothetical protein